MTNSGIIVPGMVDGTPINHTTAGYRRDYGNDYVHLSDPSNVAPVNAIGDDVRPVSGLAVLSVLCAALAIPFAWTVIPAPLAVLFGYLARVNTDDGTKRGGLLAKIGRIAGLIEMGIAALIVILMGVIAVVSWYSSPYTTK